MFQGFDPRDRGEYTIGRAEALFVREGTTEPVQIGDMDAATVAWEAEYIERQAKNSGEKRTARKDRVGLKGTLKITALQFHDLVRAIQMQGEVEAFEQTAEADLEETFQDAAGVGRFVRVAHPFVTPKAVTDGSGTVAYVVGEHIVFDTQTGLVQIRKMPDGADGAVKVAYDRAAVAADAGYKVIGLGSLDGIYGEVQFRGVNRVGRQWEARLWKVKMNPDGDTNLLGGDEFDTVSLTGEVFAASGKPAGQEYGYMRLLDEEGA